MATMKEHYCWVRAARPAQAGAQPESAAPAVPTPEANAEGVDLAGTEGGIGLQDLRLRVLWDRTKVERHVPTPPPISPRVVGASAQKMALIAGAQRLTTVHMEQAAGLGNVFDYAIDAIPVFGSREDADAWIKSPNGATYCSEAVAIALMCFTVIDEI